MSSSPNPQTFTYEQLMTSFRKSRKEMNESHEKSRREMQESHEKSRREMQEIREQLRESIRETNQVIARLGNRLGELVQAMVEGGVIRMFTNLGYEFDVYNPHYRFGNKTLGIYGEVDLFLENGELALLVEVKTNLSMDDIKEHQKRLKNFRLVADLKNDKRQFIAAVGGGVVQENVRKFALKQGMFVVQQSGENVEVLAPKGKPKVW